MTTKYYIVTYDDKDASFVLFWTGIDFVKGIGNAKRFHKQGEARREGEQAVAVSDFPRLHMKVRTGRG